MSDDRCPQCNALYALVGRVHNCRPRLPGKVEARSPKVEQRTLNPKVEGSNPSAPAKIKRGRPRLEDRAKTLKAKMPWIAMGMSRSTWYARQAEQRAKAKQ